MAEMRSVRWLTSYGRGKWSYWHWLTEPARTACGLRVIARATPSLERGTRVTCGLCRRALAREGVA